jgi:hypothetical protein
MKTVKTELFNTETPAPVQGISFNCTSKQQTEIAKYQQGGISFFKKGRNNWSVTLRYCPYDGDAMSLNATASTVARIAGCDVPEGVTQEYCNRVMKFYKTGF